MPFISKLLVGFFFLCFSLRTMAQVVPAAEEHHLRFEAGAGIDYWYTDYSNRWKFGPSAWVSTDLWRGFGVLAEGHSLIAGGDLPEYKYYVGEGGLNYTIYHWDRVRPYAKVEAGFASLSFPRSSNYDSHDTRGTWAVGCGMEYHNWQRIWTRVDYTYDGFPSFLSFVTFKKHTLNPNGVTVGLSYHFY
jgi:opacity protein-like surface antigen